MGGCIEGFCGQILLFLLFFFVQMSVWPHHSADFCECPVCSSSSFEGTHCHKDSALVLSNGGELIGWCRKCELGVPFTCGHNSCLPRQIEYPGVCPPAFRYRWLIASITIYEE